MSASVIDITGLCMYTASTVLFASMFWLVEQSPFVQPFARFMLFCVYIQLLDLVYCRLGESARLGLFFPLCFFAWHFAGMSVGRLF